MSALPSASNKDRRENDDPHSRGDHDRGDDRGDDRSGKRQKLGTSKKKAERFQDLVIEGGEGDAPEVD